MNQELDNELCEKYPLIFADRHKPMTETCMCWGFEHGDGWYNIIDQLCANIQRHINWQGKNGNPVPQVVAEQVKEKLGSLRFYYRGGDDVIDGMVRMAEAISEFTCMSCGNSSQLKNRNGWIYNICTSCEKKRQKGL